MTSLKKLSIKYFMVLIAFLVSGIFISSTCSALEIKVKDTLEIDGDTVYLGDIATFHPANDCRVSELKAIKVTASPAPDRSRTIKSDLIQNNIAYSIKSDEDINITIPDSIFIKRTARIIDKEAFEAIFKDYILDNAPWESDQIVFERINTPASVALPKGDLDLEIDEKHNKDFIGNLSILVDFKVDGDSQRKILISGRISVIKEVLKASSNINRGDIITAEDIVLVSEKCKHSRKNPITNTNDIIGKRATRRIQADQVIQTGMFEVPPAVEKGGRVVIKAENNNLLITAMGKALEEGCVGDYIRVMNVSSGREIIAMVKRTDLVEVQF